MTVSCNEERNPWADEIGNGTSVVTRKRITAVTMGQSRYVHRLHSKETVKWLMMSLMQETMRHADTSRCITAASRNERHVNPGPVRHWRKVVLSGLGGMAAGRSWQTCIRR